MALVGGQPVVLLVPGQVLPKDFDGVAIQRFVSPEAFQAFMADPAFAEKVVPDQEAFLEMSRVIWFLAEPAEVFV